LATQRSEPISKPAGVDAIWAQAGIDVEFLNNVVRHNDAFAYEGDLSDGNDQRSSSELTRIVSEAGAVVHRDDSVLNLFFTNIVPGFGFTSENTANGVGNLGRNGIAQFVGDNLLTYPDGRDVIVKVVAHEIGHNLGLKHTADGGPNLMSPQGRTQQLTPEQISAIFQATSRNDAVAYIPFNGTGFPVRVSTVLAGDYNRDGTVNAADYAVWQNSLGSTTSLAADGNSNGVVDAGDYTLWRSRFGSTGGSGAGDIASLVPEPGVSVFVAWIAMCIARRRRRKATRYSHRQVC
jgi:hypothetical protein